MKYSLALCVLLLACGGDGGPGGASSLTGTWELAGTPGSPPHGTLVLSSSRLTIALDGTTFDLNAGDPPTFSWDNGSPVISATHAPSGVDFGILPLSIGGAWTFSGAHGGQCSATISDGLMLGSCAGAGYGPGVIDNLNRHVTAMRTLKLDSAFGALGGSWTISDDRGSSCTATFQGATLTTNCGGGGGLVATFGDGVVSGTSGTGVEFSARRQ